MPAPDARSAIASGLTDLLIAAALLVVGGGALGGRRWARPMLVSLSWIWLLTGGLVVLLAIVVIPNLPVPPELAIVVRLVVLGLVLVFGVLIPAAMLMLVRGLPADSGPDSTVPQPVLVLAAALAATAVLALPSLVRPVVPVFHVLLTGWPAALTTVVMAAVCAWLARAVSRRERRGLVGTALLFVATGVSCAVTALTIEPAKIWTAMGARPEDAELFGEAPVGPRTLAAVAVLVTLASLVWLRSLACHFDRG